MKPRVVETVNAIARLLVPYLLLGLMGVLGWGFTAVQKNTVAASVQTQALNEVSQRIARLDGRLEKLAFSSYSEADAAKDFAIRDQYLNSLAARLLAVESRAD